MWNIILYILLIISVSQCEDQKINAIDSEVYEFYPCPATTKLVETFSPSNSMVYNLTIKISDFDVQPETIKAKIYFDIYANVTTSYKLRYYFYDSLSYEFTANNNKNLDPVIVISSLRGYKLPNVINVTVNSVPICKGEFYKDIWDGYAPVVEETTVKITTTSKAITLEPQQNHKKCGERVNINQGFITSGYSSKPGDWPWHVAVYRSEISRDQKYICGGTLVSNTRVVTAGHCVIEYGSILLPERLTIVLGKFNFIGDNVHTQEKNVYEIILHSNYSKSTLDNDIAILKLSSEAIFNEYVQPICLWDKNEINFSIVGRHGFVVGWGATEQDKFSSHLMETRLRIVDNVSCMKSNTFYLYKLLNDGIYCAGFGNGTNVCNGDSGGGMYFMKDNGNEKGTWFLRGVVSIGIPKRHHRMCEPQQYTLFTDVDYYKQFIEENL